MMGNFFNRMYNENGNKSDYTKDDLPGNRWGLFFSMVKLNLSKLISLNLLFFLFFLPTLVWVGLNLSLYSQAMEAANNDLMWSYVLMIIYGLVPCFLIMGVGLVPLTYITRNMARDENVWIGADFKESIKTNWKQMLIISLINGLALVLVVIGSRFYSMYYLETGNLLFYVAGILLKVIGCVWAAMNMYIWPMMVTYELRLRDLLRNSLMLCIGKLPQTLFMAVFTLILPAVLLFATSMWAYLAILAVYLLIGFSLNALAINSVTTSIFDKHINSRIKGARVNRGLRVEFDDEESNSDAADADDKNEHDDSKPV